MAVKIRTAKTKDFDAIFDFLKRSFFRDEPLNATIGLLSGDPTCVVLEENTKHVLEYGVSTVAEVEGELAGVCLNELVPIAREPRTIPQPQSPIDIAESADSKFLRIKTLMETVDISANLAELYPDCETVLDTEMISVQSSFQGKGIATKLLSAARDLAIERGVKLMRCICSSYFSALVVERMGYQCIHKMPYTQYKDTTGEPVFKTSPPHLEMTSYVLRLPS